MDLVSSCKEKLACLEVKELKNVLAQLGIVKHGSKQDLVDRILGMLSDEPGSRMRRWAIENPFRKDEVAKLIDDTYRKIYGYESSDLELNGQSGSDITTEMLRDEFDSSFQLNTKIRCPCESPLLTGPMVKCQECQVLQHTSCVIIAEDPMQGLQPVPLQFFCETCRINRADPFLVTVAYPLCPIKLATSNIEVNGANPVKKLERLFHLTRANRDLLQKPEYAVQVWCILLNDRVPFRMHWPQYADLQVNGIAIQATNRHGSQLLGANGRDNGPIITACINNGVNRISLTGYDARIFCLGVRIVKQQTVEQVLNLIPKEPYGEQLEDALARVCRCIGGGAAIENADSDTDLEIVTDSVIVNLRCPMSGSRIKIAGRFRPCTHMGCFDLETFVELNQRSRKWQCPICLKNYSLENIIIDPYFNRITTMMRNCGEDITEIEVKPDGYWRTKKKNECPGLAQWHCPDGTLSFATDEVNLNTGTLNQFKQESILEKDAVLKSSGNKNCNVSFYSNTPEDTFILSSANILQEKYGDDASVNQENGGYFYLPANDGIELDSASMNFYPTCGAAHKDPSALVGDGKIIVLSDSEEENDNLISPQTACETGQADSSWINFYVPHLGTSNSHPEDLALANDGSSCLSILNGNDDSDLIKPHRLFLSGAPSVSWQQLFDSEVNVSDTHAQGSSLNCPFPFNDSYFAPEMHMGSPTRIPDSSYCSNSGINDSLFNNSLPFYGDAPTLQIFLPTRSDGTVEQSDSRGQPGLSNGLDNKEWISLCHGSGKGNGGLGNSADENGLNLGNQFTALETPMDS